MSNQQNWNEVGRQIRDAVQGAISSGDFKEVNQIVSASVSKALSDARRQVEEAVAGICKEPKSQSAQPKSAAPETKPAARKPAKIKWKKKGNITGIMLMVFGGIGTGVSAMAVFATLMVFLTDRALAPLLRALLVLIGFFIIMQWGTMKRNRIKRAKRYVELCGGKSYIDIEELALHMGKSEKYILKDVKKMIKMGIFPEGHLDEQESCLILTDAVFGEYLRLKKERKTLELEERVARMQERQSASGQEAFRQKEEEKVPVPGEINSPETPAEDPELAAMIREGNDCIRRLRDMNDVIEGEVISAKLFRLEELLKEIFERVREHPEQMPQMQKFMNYYLPTTLKLVEAYAEFDDVSVPGQDIILAKQEIEKTLDTINQAFAELLNKLFRSSVFDVTTDAQVLQTMLAKEGLTRDREFEQLSR